MTARSRSRGVNAVNGTWRRFGDVSGGGVKLMESESCQDHIGPGDCDQFLVNRWKRSGAVMHQQHDAGFFAAYFQNYITDGSDESNFPHIGIVGAPASAESALRAINRTSPSRAYVDVPAACLQLGEIIRLLQGIGENLIREVGKQNLRLQFGMTPIVTDLAKIMVFNELVDRRVHEIEKLYTQKGLRRTVDIGEYVSNANFNLVFQSQGQFSQLPVSGQTNLKIRAHCRWSPTEVPGLRTPKSIRRLAQRALTGATIDFYTLWQIMPWSWLIDWGFDVGAYLKAHRNTVPATLSKCVVIEHTKTNYTAPGYAWPDWYVRTQSPFSLFRERKQRIVPIVSPTAHFPFLSGNQMGIVASLAVARARL